MKAIKAFLWGSWSELKKVTWPSRSEVVRYTLQVIALSLVVAAFVGVVDLGLLKLVNFIL